MAVRSPRLGTVARLAALLLAALILAACETAPITGRQQLILMPEAQAEQIGIQAFQQIKADQPVVRGRPENRMIEEIGRRIAHASALSGYNWEFILIQDPSPNAFALPGGKVGVHTGLFRVARTEDQVAAVIAHEVAHVMARHSAERMSRQMLLQYGLGGLAGLTGPGAQAMVEIAAQAATLGLLLPFTREQEAEADHIGLMLMARAGYDPRAAIELWHNMGAVSGNGRPPEFLSTHPSPANRIARMEALMPEALAIYAQHRR
ncbi:MAG: M48 family peptidase [Rhodospirillales bacterium]|nr:MAG: M48 family peptidase [Rhodospirillales bacterium]